MKCLKCNGTGKVSKFFYEKIANNKYQKVCGDVQCEECNGTGEITQTNEEWLKSLDTEGLVDYLYEVHKGGDSVERQAWIEKHKERIKMQFRGWLKEKHHAE